MNVIYRVVLKISYRSAWFDFTDASDACNMAKLMIEHLVPGDEDDNMAKIVIEVINEGFEDCEESD